MGAAASHIDGTGHQLVKAAKLGDAEHVMELISARPELLYYATYRQMSPAHFAAREDHTEVLQQLFSKAAEVEHYMRLHQQQSRRHRSSHVDLVHQLANTTTDRGVTPLMLAVDKGCLASVKLLLAKGADPWAVDKLGGRTALHYAARQNNVEVVQALLEAAGEAPGPVRFPNRPSTRFIDVRTQTGFTALHFAVHTHTHQALAVLLNHGANLLLSSLFDCLDCINCPRGSTPLHLAARAGNTDASRQLLKAYVEVWQHRALPDPRLVMDGDDRLPCQLAARRQHDILANMLLPTTPLSSLFADGQLTVIGPRSLAAIAGAVLRDSMTRELHAISQQLGPAAEVPAAPAPAAEDSPAEHQHQQQLSRVSGCSTGSDELCGVCFDSQQVVQLAPCGHQLCVSCCRHLLALEARCVLVCPFCRGGVGHLTAAVEV